MYFNIYTKFNFAAETKNYYLINLKKKSML